MRPADLVFWLDVLRDGNLPDNGVLCQRHADSMVVPRGWTLDDLRDPDLHLFRPPSVEGLGRAHTAKSRPSKHSTSEQLEFSVESGDEIAGDTHVASDGGSAPNQSEDSDFVTESDLEDPPPEPWTPTFDDDDDLDGLLTAQSPLLSRAFRGAERRSPS